MRVLRAAPLQVIAARSYSLYLWHFPVAFAFNSLPGPLQLAVQLTVSVALAELTYRFVERRFLAHNNPLRETVGRGAGGRLITRTG